MSENNSNAYMERFRLRSMPSAQCHVIIQEDEKGYKIELISYSTLVCTIMVDYQNIQLFCTGTYSTTTARHINRFTKEFFGENLYYECKRAIRVENATDVRSAFGINYLVHSVEEYEPDYEPLMAWISKVVDKYKHDARKYYGRY